MHCKQYLSKFDSRFIVFIQFYSPLIQVFSVYLLVLSLSLQIGTVCIVHFGIHTYIHTLKFVSSYTIVQWTLHCHLHNIKRHEINN